MARVAAADGTPEGPKVIVRDPSRPFGAEVGRLRLTPRHYAYLRVAEGCDHACTFCAIPGFRGRFRSKPEEAILREAAELARDGAREICLIAEDTNQYGQDRRDGTDLAALLGKLAAIEGVEWLRILYAYPAYFPDALVDAIASIEKVVKYLDIPLQHIADPVLKRMNRPGKKRTIELLERLRAKVPGLALRTTFIAGFPGETESDFEELLRFVEGFGFDRMGAFPFSEEDGTPAGSMEGQLDPALREERRNRLMEAQQRVAFAKNQAKLGREVRVIVDEPEGSGRAVARTEHDAPEIDGSIRLWKRGREFRPGEILLARVEKAKGYDLEGTPLA
jgi:ribosomal protein S12 methylthiotransferase